MYNNYRYFVVFNTIYTTIVTIFGYSGKVIIPAEINGHKVTKICDGAFRDSQISLIEFEAPDNIESIGMGAFYNCSLEKIDIPNVKYIFTNTFENCINLSEVSIPKSVKSIEEYAFCECRELKDVTISEGVEHIGMLAFNNCQNIGDVQIPASVKKIDAYAFNLCWYWNEGTIKFIRKTDFEYDNSMLWNDNRVSILIPIDAKENYTNYDGTIIFEHVSNDKVTFYN